MELNSLRLNVAYFAGCSTFSVFAKIRYRFQSFT